ncbi:DUF6119 family protein [Umezawaea beigongshangensis]|uniref:DUF6119 family protein n=1 Tax=Umezawaea beigongshangensis TaxID=2780383 RepID=UPI0018F165DE|nr:DUF6119 family protein [Umezawaea beigongshangensis]
MRITLYLLREGVEFSSAALRDGDSFQEVQLLPVDDFEWKLFVLPRSPKEPTWATAVRSLVISEVALDELRIQSSAGVLLARVDGRIFALTFSSGFHAIAVENLEPGFGLRVTANVIASDKVVSADTKGFSSSSRSQKIILPSASELHELGIETSEEWVKNLGGKVVDADFASTAAGADSLRLTIKDFSLRKLPEKLKEISKVYQDETYKSAFGFLDNFTRIDKRDPLVERLDAAVEKMLRAESDELGFAAPDPFEHLDADHYQIRYRRKVVLDDLNAEDVYAAIKEFNLPKSAVWMHRVMVIPLKDDGNPADREYKLYNYIQAEIEFPGEGRFALTSGVWFRIAASFLDEVRNFVGDIEDISDDLALEPWDTKVLNADSAEGEYNTFICNKRGYVHLDKKNFHFGRYEKVEICDALTADKKLLCVKRASQSSTLSHLFSQASVSAALMNEADYRNKVVEHLGGVLANASFGTHADWTFVYAIATKKPGRLADSLFFFSKVNLFRHAKIIRSCGFKVALARIEIV